MEYEETSVNKNMYTIENVFCGTKTASEIYKEIIEKILGEDCEYS